MIKLIFLILIFLLSLLVLFRAPTSLLWYISIIVTEFSWVLIMLILVIFFLPSGTDRLNIFHKLFGSISLLLLLLPYWQAWQIGQQLKKGLPAVFHTAGPAITPFSPIKIFSGINSRKIRYTELTYDTANKLMLHFYAAETTGLRPCIVVIHGGSWAGGNNLQLPELNSELAKEGYHVASINYRLAPLNRFPVPLEDVRAAITFLQLKSQALQIDTTRFILLGRSAGGQVALSAAYTKPEAAIRGVINFYGPADMVWGYENPTNPLVLDSRKIMEDYLGGTLEQVREQYIRSSATETVTATTPPTLLIYAGNDPLVSPKHATRLGRKLGALKIPHYTLYLPWATHAFDYTLNGPGGQLSTWTVKYFLEAVLGDAKSTE